MTEELQYELFNLNDVESQVVWIATDALPSNDKLISPPPGRAFVEDVRNRGIIQPILIADTDGNGSYYIVAGCRRIKAARILGITQIPAVIRNMDQMTAMLARSADNNQQHDNDLADIETIRYFLSVHLSAKDSTLSKLTGIPTGRVKKLRKMATLPEDIITGIKTGAVSVAAAKEMSEMSSSQQRKVMEVMRDNEAENHQRYLDGKPLRQTLTAEDVQKIARLNADQTFATEVPQQEVMFQQWYVVVTFMSDGYPMVIGTPTTNVEEAQQQMGNDSTLRIGYLTF